MDSIILMLTLVLSSVTLCTSDRGTEAVNYAYMISGGDMPFVGTVAQESMFDSEAVGDKIKGEYMAYGFCQYRKDYNKWGYDTYRALPTWQEKMDMCYRSYSVWKEKGQLGSRLYGWKQYKTGLSKLNIKCE